MDTKFDQMDERIVYDSNAVPRVNAQMSFVLTAAGEAVSAKQFTKSHF